jgi:hypothetical protein
MELGFKRRSPRLLDRLQRGGDRRERRVQEDITFDLTNRRLMILRVVLGGLFGLVLTLPFGFQDFLNFCSNIGGAIPLHEKPGDTVKPSDSVTWQAVTLLMPFVLGFSTSLVILVLNQLVDGIQAFFGKRSTAANADRATAPISPSSAMPPSAFSAMQLGQRIGALSGARTIRLDDN